MYTTSHEKSLTLCITQRMRDISTKVSCMSFPSKCAKVLNDFANIDPKMIEGLSQYYLYIIISIYQQIGTNYNLSLYVKHFMLI